MASQSTTTPARPAMPEAWQRLATGDYGESGLDNALRAVFAIVRRNLWLILAIMLICISAALLITMLDTPRYMAIARVQVNDQSEQVLGEDIDNQTATNSYWDVDRFLNTQLEILRSRTLAERVTNKLELGGSDRFYGSLGMARPAGSDTDDLVIDLLLANLEVNLPRDTRVVRIGFISSDPSLSAQIANGFAEEYIQLALQRRFDSSAYARNFVSEQLDDARIRLEESERELNLYARQNGLIRTRDMTQDGGTSAGSVTASSLMQVNEEANRAQASRVTAEARWLTVQSAPLMSSQVVLGNPAVQALMADRARLEGRLGAARERYFDSHPEVMRLTDEMNAVTAQLNATARQVRDSVRAEFVAAQQAESRLRGEVSRLEGATLAEHDRAVRYNILAREVDTNRSLYDGLLQRFRELNAAAGIAASNIQVLDRAEVPKSPWTPDPFRNLALGLLAGLSLSGALVFLRSQLDDVVRVPEDVEEKAHLPLLGVIPRAPSDNPRDELADPRSAISEAYNSLRGTLLYSTREGLPHLMLITSAQPTEGKTTTSLATATSLARMGKRTVLVDADLRRPSLHRRVEIDNERGLSTLLVTTDACASAIVESGEENLFILPSGPIPPSPTELLTSPRMAMVLEELASQFDVVIIDSPPVLGLADAPVLAALVDGVVLVIEADRGRGGSLKTALRRLRAMDPVMLGAVLTKFSATRAGNRYSEYYGYDYYRYELSEDEKS